ncbi:MAG: 3-dehydroquinate synthase [Nitrospirales bacterium]|nr:3-dehydroquinate synthase [Nitrospirales bacterium]
MTNQPSSVRVSLGKRSYDILIQEDLIANVAQYLAPLKLSRQVGIISNARLHRLYGTVLVRHLRKHGYEPHVIILPDGEQAKTLRWASKILDELVAQRFERRSVLLALGGGVIGDITGFVASMYLRGIPFIQIATSLVAQVDSSVGGKTGVNHARGKNLIGAFYQPALVLIDTAVLLTLPKREWLAGLAEVIKYGVIADAKFFAYLEQQTHDILTMQPEAVRYLVKRCCEIKASVVRKDERESGLRQILNYGHTVGHALEALGKYRKWIHGEAVAMGMVLEAEISHALGYCSAEIVERQQHLVQRVGLPTGLPSVTTFSQLWSAMLHDKKVVCGAIHCVLPSQIGKVTVQPLERRVVKQWFQKRGRQQAT